MKLPLYLIFLSVILIGCTPASIPRTAGSLGYEESRRFIIVGENVDPTIAAYYQKKYGCMAWFTPFEGRFANNANNLFQSGLGPSVAMRSLIKELKSMNYSFGQWEIIVPGIAENYFLRTLKNMKSRSLSKARGIVVLIDSSNNKKIESQVNRVSDGNFFVSYEFQKE